MAVSEWTVQRCILFAALTGFRSCNLGQTFAPAETVQLVFWSGNVPFLTRGSKTKELSKLNFLKLQELHQRVLDFAFALLMGWVVVHTFVAWALEL